MNYFDDEARIIEYLQMAELPKVHFLNFTLPLVRFFISLHSSKHFCNWVNSSSKSAVPPDFYSDKYKVMLEVMRFDDYEVGSNSPNALESQFYKRIERQFTEHGKRLEKDQYKFLLMPDYSKVSENNLALYYENFRRVVEKHARKTGEYREAHPGYELGFLLCDESPAYIEAVEKQEKIPPEGVPIKGRYYEAPKDKRFIDVLLETDVDFIIWMTPYKEMPGNPKQFLIETYLLDVNKAKRKPVKHVNYDYERVMCLEVY